MDEKTIIQNLYKHYNKDWQEDPESFEKNNLTLKIMPYSSDISKEVTICINGNRSSLISLAMEILEVAFGNFNHCHSDIGAWKFKDYDAELCISLEYNKNE